MNARIGLVIPWYGENIPGGAEAACRALAGALQTAGAEVEVLTTTVREFASDWNRNFHAEGVAVEGGICVRRFRVRKRDTAAFDAVNRILARGLSPPISEQDIYLRENIRSPALCEFLDRHRSGYIYLFMPYLFGTTVDGVQTAGERGVLIPCLHEEPQARMARLQSIFYQARGVVFLSEAERRLAFDLMRLDAAKTAVLGCPVELGWTADAERFRRRAFAGEFLLYAGRTGAGKGFDLLVEYFARYLEQRPAALKLAVAGGDFQAPAWLRPHLVSLGYVPQECLRDAMAASLAVVTPGVRESFSLVMMEAWLAGRPVIANAACPVTSGFCRLAGGGLYFASYPEFREILDELRANPGLAAQLGRQGREFVRANFEPGQVAARYLETLRAWFA